MQIFGSKSTTRLSLRGPMRQWATPLSAPPGIPATPNPATDSPNISTDLQLGWAATEGATSYIVTVWKSTEDEADGTSDTVYTNSLNYGDEHGPIDANTVYHWRVTAVNAAGSTAGSVWRFATGSSLLFDLFAAWDFDDALIANSVDTDFPSGGAKYTLTQSGTWTQVSSGGKEGGYISSVGAASRALLLNTTYPTQFTVGAFFQRPGLATPAIASITSFGLYTDTSTNYKFYIYSYNNTDGRYTMGARWRRADGTISQQDLVPYATGKYTKHQTWFWVSARYNGTNLVFDIAYPGESIVRVSVTPVGGLISTNYRLVYQTSPNDNVTSDDIDGLVVAGRAWTNDEIDAVLTRIQYPFTA